MSNPGCYATGAIALIAPLVAAGLIAPDEALTRALRTAGVEVKVA